MNEYLIVYSYWNNGRRIKEYDTFFACSAQEAVNECREESELIFSAMKGQIESVHVDTSRTWEYITNWE